MPSKSKTDLKAKLEQRIAVTKKRLAEITAVESRTQRKLEVRGAIVFAAMAKKLDSALLNRVITHLQDHQKTPKDAQDLVAVKAFRDRKDGGKSQGVPAA